MATLARARIAISPLWETLSSVVLLARYRGEVPFPYTGWAAAARRAVQPALRRELATVLTTRDWSASPTPVPDGPAPLFTDELAALRAAGEHRLAELIGDYWPIAVEPHWNAMRSVLEEEILVRGRTLVTKGPDAMLSDLNGRLDWESPVLSIPHRADMELDVRDHRLLLVPVVFARGMRIFTMNDDVVAVSYQAQGATVLSATGPVGDAPVDAPQLGDRLSIVLGRGRAAVMRNLVSPITTTALASAVGLAASTVSEHLSVLFAAGLVRRRRAGSRVLYELEKSGRVLLSQLDG
ncbi:winged helix-turn-helix domain-containing protein [Actinoplanes sp. NEAU-A12]|uniref:Winged helix-turn-helix domain-containing protein n=1 Tax=Actinoplanes sandaracinus TaxID=3045177 RepID=A0ABT6WRB8_9ACTN|nr:winged helix-turn-helix domain-containing protein [Actinoplanes sandaracinus]MDI6102287.1 winged helix-turn-helix domain-containing protein [Actinoplanes sandaracinus]